MLAARWPVPACRYPSCGRRAARAPKRLASLRGSPLSGFGGCNGVFQRREGRSECRRGASQDKWLCCCKRLISSGTWSDLDRARDRPMSFRALSMSPIIRFGVRCKVAAKPVSMPNGTLSRDLDRDHRASTPHRNALSLQRMLQVEGQAQEAFADRDFGEKSASPCFPRRKVSAISCAAPNSARITLATYTVRGGPQIVRRHCLRLRRAPGARTKVAFASSDWIPWTIPRAQAARVLQAGHRPSQTWSAAR